MSSEMSIVMFDDDPDRKGKASTLEEATGFRVHFVDLNKKDVVATIEGAIASLPEPQLVLVDHVLSMAVRDSAVHKGSSIVPLLREKWPSAPVIALTAAYEDCCGDIASEVYESVCALESFSELVSYIPSIVEGYQLLREQVHSLKDLVRVLNTPESEREALKDAIPVIIRKRVGSPVAEHHIFRWFKGVFYRKPGFIWNKRWTALGLGVDDAYFDVYRSRLTGALYDGVFANKDDPRWWKTLIYGIVLPSSPKRFSTSLYEAARETLAIPSEHISKCTRCSEPYPEVLGYTDEAAISESLSVPLHLRCSQKHPLAEVDPFYEELRLMLEES